MTATSSLRYRFRWQTPPVSAYFYQSWVSNEESRVEMLNNFHAGIYALGLVLASTECVAAADATYFIYGGNPVAVKYGSGRLARLPFQSAEDVESLKTLETVSALLGARQLTGLSTSARPPVARISPPRVPEYGVAMFDVAIESAVAQQVGVATLVWSGPAQFREILPSLPGTDKRLKQSLVAQSRRVLTSKLDLRDYEPVGRRLEIDGFARIRDYGRAVAAPQLAFVDIIWHIKDLPEALSNRGIDSWSPFLRVKYVVDTRTGRTVYRNTTNEGGIEDRGMRLFKEPGGPLLMAVIVGCADGGEPLILDLEHDSYGTGRQGDVPEVSHCFPAQ